MQSHRRLLKLGLLLLAAGCSATAALAMSTDDREPDAAVVEAAAPAAQMPRAAFAAASVPLAEEVAAMFRVPEDGKPEAAAETEPAAEAVPEAAPASPAFALLYWTALGLHPEWRPDYCDHPFVEQSTKVVCERNRDRGQKWAGQLAFYIYTEASRQRICDPRDALCYVWFMGQGQRESGLSQGDICKVSLPVAWVEEVPEDAELNTRVRMCWRRGESAGRNCQKVYLRAHSDREYVVDRCAYDEVGIFQVRAHEARRGQIIPASGMPLPASWTERRELLLEPWWNISLAFEAFAKVRDYCCGVGEEADEFCRLHPDAFLGCYNSGKCKGRQAIRYVDKIGRAIVKAMGYVCQVLPAVDLGGFDVCDQEDVSNYFTPPGHPRRRAASRGAS